MERCDRYAQEETEPRASQNEYQKTQQQDCEPAAIQLNSWKSALSGSSCQATISHVCHANASYLKVRSAGVLPTGAVFARRSRLTAANEQHSCRDEQGPEDTFHADAFTQHGETENHGNDEARANKWIRLAQVP